MFLFDKHGYLKFGIPEEVVNVIVRKYAEQEEAKRNPEVGMMVANLDGIKKLELTSEVIHSKEIPSGCICANCGGSGKIPCYDGECYICAMDDYCEDALPCYCTPTSTLEKNQGMYCKRCNIFNEYIAVSNQTDGSYLCYSCRS